MNPILYNAQASNQSIYAASAIQEHPVGTRGYSPDGQVFYYATNTSSSTFPVGELLVRPEVIATAHHSELAVAAGGGALGQKIVSSITIGATLMSVNQYAEGTLTVTDGLGQGHTYKIRKHAAFDSAATTVSVELYDNIAVALDSTSTVTFTYNAYDDPQQGNADQLDIPVGVPRILVPAGNVNQQWAWVQTWGECSVLCDEAVTAIGQAMTIGSSLVGSIEEDDTATTVSQEFIVGYNITPAVDTEFQLIYLTIRP